MVKGLGPRVQGVDTGIGADPQHPGTIDVQGVDEVIKVEMAHVGSLGKILCNLGFSRGFWTKDHHGLWKNSRFGLCVNLTDISSSINPSNLSELFVVLNYWVTLIKVILNSLLDGLGIIIGPSTCLSSFHASLEHNFLGHIVVEYLLCLQDVLLKILRLVNCSGETVD